MPKLLVYQDIADSPLKSPALVTLGRLGPAASAAVPKLVELLPTEGEKRTITIIEALGRIGCCPRGFFN